MSVAECTLPWVHNKPLEPTAEKRGGSAAGRSADTTLHCQHMKETDEDIEELQNLLSRSIERAGDFLRSSFQMPKHSLSARQLVHYLNGIKTVALATVTAQGEPRVTPVSSMFYRGEFHVPTVTTAARAKHIERSSAISLSYFEEGDLAVIVHGHGRIVRVVDPRFADLEHIQKEVAGETVRD